MPSRREFLGLIGISALSRPLGSELVLRSGQSDLLGDSHGRVGNPTRWCPDEMCNQAAQLSVRAL